MAHRQEGLTLLVFIGGLSAATGMVIVETIALSTMVCNDLVMPILLRWRGAELAESKDLSQLLLGIRRGAIVVILLLGYLYFRLAGEAYALVAIGLISFAAVAQFAPAMIGEHVLARRDAGWRAGRVECRISGVGLHPAVAIVCQVWLAGCRLPDPGAVRFESAASATALWLDWSG